MPKRSPTLTLAPLWSHKDKNGNMFLAGPILGNLTLMVFFIPKADRVDKGPSARAVIMMGGEREAGERGQPGRADDDVPF
jgi:hypothetical protein